MLSSAATFSFFLAIGSVSFPVCFPLRDIDFGDKVIRTDSMLPPHLEAAYKQLAPATMIHSRAEGAQLMKARWEAERRRLATSKA
jgi:hypothetical protein